MDSILSNINDINDLKTLNLDDLNILSEEIRWFLIENLSKSGGHLASNLGVVELTLALHMVFNSPKDKIIWDVGHQAYVHKILTGRRDKFHTIRQYKGLSGFPKRKESEHDIFETGHSSTSISSGVGIALARDLKGENNHVISVIGDGAMTAGMVYEALNHAGDLGTKFMVVLNDNNMSISKNVGSISRYLNKLRTANSYKKMKDDVETILNGIPCIGKRLAKTVERVKDSFKYLLVPGSFFEELGFKYLGPIDGHNIESLMKAMNMAKEVNGPVLIHTVTKKGKGYIPAENMPDKFHGVGPFNIKTGETSSKTNIKSYSDVLGESLLNIAQKNEKIVTITAAMPSGTGLNYFKQKFPDRFFDVGIAEQHGVTLAAGLASQGLKPFYAVYSSFLQRGYDQILHDVCIQNLPVVFAVDRAGLVGSDGETHHGVFDISYLSHMPNMTIMAPKDKNEFIKMIEFSSEFDGPIALRYPRGNCIDIKSDNSDNEIKFGKGEIIKSGCEIALLGVGKMVDSCIKIAEILSEEGIDITVINARFVKPFDKELLDDICKNHKLIVTLEDNVKIGGYGSYINDYLNTKGYLGEVINLGYPDKFIEHGSIDELMKANNMDTDSVLELIKSKIKLKNIAITK